MGRRAAMPRKDERKGSKRDSGKGKPKDSGKDKPKAGKRHAKRHT